MDRTPDLTRALHRAPRSRRPGLLAAGGVLTAACLLTAGCAAQGPAGAQGGAAVQGPGDGLPVVVHVVVEGSCPRAEAEVPEDSPLLVGGARARVRSGCTQDGLESVFTFDARMPASSTVVLSPGEMRGVVVDAARASAAGEVTLRYAADDGTFRPVTTSYGNGEDEPVRRSR